MYKNSLGIPYLFSETKKELEARSKDFGFLMTGPILMWSILTLTFYRDGMGGPGPGGRIGHSMVLAGNDSRVILFGGRDNEIMREHIPRTYEVRLSTRQHASRLLMPRKRRLLSIWKCSPPFPRLVADQSANSVSGREYKNTFYKNSYLRCFFSAHKTVPGSRKSVDSMYVWSSHIARVWINRVRLPILLVVS